MTRVDVAGGRIATRRRQRRVQVGGIRPRLRNLFEGARVCPSARGRRVDGPARRQLRQGASARRAADKARAIRLLQCHPT